MHLVDSADDLFVCEDYLTGEEVHIRHLFAETMLEGVVEVREFGSPTGSSGVRDVILLKCDQSLMIRVDGEVVTVVKVVVELEGSPYYH